MRKVSLGKRRPLFRKPDDEAEGSNITTQQTENSSEIGTSNICIKRKRKLLPVVSAYTSHDFAAPLQLREIVTSVESSTVNPLASDVVGKDGCIKPEAVSNRVTCSTPEGSRAIEKITSRQTVDDDLLQGLCPEDLMNCSASFCTSIDESTVECVQRSDHLPPEIHVMTPRIQSSCCHPDSNSKITCTNPVHSTPKSKQFLHCSPLGTPVTLPESPTSRHSEPLQCPFPSDTFYGLPLKVKDCMEEYRGIKTLYDWQDTCLRLPSVMEGHNLIYSLPTSGGKTLVAELIIFRQLLLSSKDVLFILPFVSIVQEKVRDMIPFSNSLGFAVEEYAAGKGKLPPRNRRKKHVVYIATIEKANSLINSLVDQGRLLSLGLVVVDELHMLGDGTVRGATLETCLAKVLHCSRSTQIVGMSATLSNIHEIAQFLRAEVYSDDFRPVELVQYAKVGKCVYYIKVESGHVNFDPVRDISDTIDAQLDPDQLGALVLEVVPHSSCLVFCPTKKNCQNVALLLAKCLQRSQRVKEEERHNLLRLLNIEASGVCPILAQTIPYGTAYHHSGLTADERRIIEDGYSKGILSVLTCTSTLAAGVNLPAKRVILRSPYVGNQFLSQSQYKQMIGRAGRSGYCEKGESILMFKDCDKEKVSWLLSSSCERCESSLVSSGVSVLSSLVLTLIGVKLVKASNQLDGFLESTLAYIQTGRDYLKQQCQQVLSKLVESKYITMETGDNSTYSITPLGIATLKGCIPVECAHLIHKDLLKSQQCLVLTTDLHLLFLTVSAELSTSIQPNWMRYFENLTSLGSDELKVAELIGVQPGVLSKKATGLTAKMTPETAEVYHRFYLSLMLHYLLKSNSPSAIWKVAHLFQCSRGFLQSVINSTASFASCLTYFTQELPELWALSLLFPVVSKKLAFSSNVELVPLMEVQGIKQGRARQLVSVGISTPQQLAATDSKSLCEMVDYLYLKQAKRMVQSAKALLSDQAEALMEEAEELISLIPC